MHNSDWHDFSSVSLSQVGQGSRSMSALFKVFLSGCCIYGGGLLLRLEGQVDPPVVCLIRFILFLKLIFYLITCSYQLPWRAGMERTQAGLYKEWRATRSILSWLDSGQDSWHYSLRLKSLASRSTARKTFLMFQSDAALQKQFNVPLCKNKNDSRHITVITASEPYPTTIKGLSVFHALYLVWCCYCWVLSLTLGCRWGTWGCVGSILLDRHILSGRCTTSQAESAFWEIEAWTSRRLWPWKVESVCQRQQQGNGMIWSALRASLMNYVNYTNEACTIHDGRKSSTPK